MHAHGQPGKNCGWANGECSSCGHGIYLHVAVKIRRQNQRRGKIESQTSPKVRIPNIPVRKDGGFLLRPWFYPPTKPTAATLCIYSKYG